MHALSLFAAETYIEQHRAMRAVAPRSIRRGVKKDTLVLPLARAMAGHRQAGPSLTVATPLGAASKLV